MHARNTFGINYLLNHLNGTPIQYKFLTNRVFSLALFFDRTFGCWKLQHFCYPYFFTLGEVDFPLICGYSGKRGI